MTQDHTVPRRVADLDDVKAWIAEHDGRMEAWWGEQRRLNTHQNTRLDNVVTRVSAVERRIVMLASAAAAGGGIVGQMAANLLGG